MDCIAIASRETVTYSVRANRTTVLWIWATYSLAFFGSALTGGLRQLLGMTIAALVSAGMTGYALRATIRIQNRDKLTIRYLSYTFADRLENIQIVPTPKFDFRSHKKLGVKRLYQGTRLPCFHVGWFVLRNGSVAFVCVSRKRKARAFKTHDGCYILVDPRIARRIRAAAASSDV